LITLFSLKLLLSIRINPPYLGAKAKLQQISFFLSLIRSETFQIINEISKNLKIERNEIFRKKRGNLHHQLALYLIKRYTPISLREIGKLFGMDYAAVSQSVKRLEGKTQRDKRALMIKETAIGRLKKS